jgi:RNA polymerase sigma factor (sigma-70 family)
MDKLIALSMEQKQQRVIDAVKYYGKRLFAFIRNRVKNDEDAEDILQDVWFQLCSIIDIEPIEQLSSWLYRVSKNRIIDKKRKKSTLSIEDFIFEDEDGEILIPEALLTENITPDKELEKAYFMELLFTALSELPEKQRQVFILNEIEGITLQEIADKTGENIKTIISRKGYALAHLRKRLKNIYNN